MMEGDGGGDDDGDDDGDDEDCPKLNQNRSANAACSGPRTVLIPIKNRYPDATIDSNPRQ